ncbi:hypothetical protein DFH09DRAFT_1087924 [Mycena vulgaris]|nr:hypothetical protein DFH09DRAFT_1087924 [Mycena vulgaris]
MDKDLASVSENLHGSFVYRMGRGGKAHLVDGLALGRAIIAAETLNAPLKIRFPGDYGALRTCEPSAQRRTQLLPMFPEFGIMERGKVVINFLQRALDTPQDGVKWPMEAQRIVEMRREDRRIERFLDIGDSRWNENKPFQHQKQKVSATLATGASFAANCVVRNLLCADIGCEYRYASRGGQRGREESHKRRQLFGEIVLVCRAHEGMKEAIYGVYAEGRSTPPRSNARAAANNPEKPPNLSKPVNGVDPGSKTASGWHEMPARGMDDKDQVANEVHVTRCGAMKRHFWSLLGKLPERSSARNVDSCAASGAKRNVLVKLDGVSRDWTNPATDVGCGGIQKVGSTGQ